MGEERNLGEGVPGETVRGTLLLCNTGSTPRTVLRLAASCGCTEIEPAAPFTIPPHGECELRVGMRLESEGEHRVATLEVECDDPVRPHFDIRLSATAPAFAKVQPDSLCFSVAPPGRATSQVLRITNPAGDPWPGVHLLEIESTSPAVRVHPTTREGEVEVTFEPGDVLGVVSGELTVRHLEADRVLRVPFLGRVRKPLTVAPSIVVIDSRAPAPRRVVVKREDGSQLGPFQHAEADKGIGVTERARRGSVAELEIKMASHASPPKGRRTPVHLWFEGYDVPADLLLVVR